jgi:hypothetical protein
MGKCFTYVSPELKMFHLQILKMRTISLKFFLKPLKHGRLAFSVNLRIIESRFHQGITEIKNITLLKIGMNF